MIRPVAGSVILDPAEVGYVAGALERLAELMAERRDPDGQPAPVQPSAQLVALTAKLRRTGDTAAALAIDNSAFEQQQRAETPEPIASARALQRNSGHSGPHDIGTAEAARRLGITANGVRDAIRRGRLDARRSGGRWVVDAASTDAHAARKATRRAG